MQKKLFRRITASLILSVMLFALPVGAFIANTSNAVTAYAEDDVSGNESGDNTDPGDGTGDATDGETIGGETGDGNTDNGNAGDGETGNGNSDNGEGDESGEGGEEGDDPEPTPEPTPEPEPECICDHKCSQYDYNKDCPVCSANYKDCQYKDPSVKITIDAPSGWYGRGSSVKVKFKVEDILDTGNFAVKSVRAKIGQNGSYQDVTEDMYIEITENCSVYVLVTDANDKSYERSRSINCFDTTKPTLNAAVSEGLLTVQASDTESGIKVIYVNGYEFKDDITNGTLNIRLSQFDAGYEYFTITAMDNAGNVSEVYKTKNPYYKDPKSEDDSNPAEQLPVSAEATNPSSATATVTQHTQTDSNGNTTSQTPKTPEQQKKEEFARADAEEAALSDDEKGEDMNLTVDVITIAAPDLRDKSNVHVPLVNGGTYMNNAELFGYHVKRAIHMLTCAAAKGADILVLGAFGCGAFQNNPEVVARAYKTALLEFPKVFKQIEFAVYCPPGGSRNYDVFRKVLG